MFSTLLIANRGEIACRIIKTARHLGVKTVAVYSEADARSLHAQMADEAYCVGPAAARESYLNIDALLDAAVRAGADAVHPGYGFLSEDAEFAQAVADAGMVFIGPSPTAIAAMGSKSAAKQLMMEAGVPLVPGYHGADQALETLRAEALKVGYPIMLKASAGGGGRGMRIVTTPGEFDDNVASAKREAMAAFSSDELLIERYVSEPRHVEVQVFGDHGGNIVHLFERDCSVQRRHQKIVEEAPGPGISSSLRERICAAAMSAAKAIDYVGAGTVEFLLDRNEQFYFMEMNTRLQVEHPVTELITGYDLVEWQLRVAAGDPLPARQDEITIRGHAVEVRLYAENPNKDFMPSTGELKHLYFPDHYPLVRVDTGFRGGDNVSVHYDPMLAKVIAWGSDRDEACARLADALHETQVVGVTTNAEYLAALLGHEAFLSGQVNTGFIATHGPELTEQPNGISPQAIALVGAKIGFDYVMSAHERSRGSMDPCSPWGIADGWRLNSRAAIRETVSSGERDIGIEITVQEPGACDTGRAGDVANASREMRFDIRIDGERTVSVQGDLTPHPNELLAVVIDGVRQKVALVADGDTYHVFINRRRHLLDHHDTQHDAETVDAGQGSLAAPMPGKIISVLVEQGQSVNRGAPLMVLEAMKMEHTINAPIDGKVTEVHFKQGDLVEENAELAVVTPH